MKIIYLTESMGWSGGAEQVLLMAGALRDRGHDVLVACQPESDILQRAQAAHLATEPLRIRQDYDVLAARRLAHVVQNHQAEVLHAQHSTAHAIGLMATFWTKIPVFVVTRRVIFPIKKNPFSWFKYRSRRISGYVANCQSVKAELLKAGIPAARIEVIPSTIDGQWVSHEDGLALRQELGLPLVRPVIGMVANYSAFKGHEFFLQAAAQVLQRFPEVHFLMAGRDTEKLQPLVDRLRLSRSVHLLGFRTDVPRLLAALDLFVMPSLQEGAATAVREAMAAGVAAIGTDVGGIPESIRDGETGLLVPPSDSQALAQAMGRLLAEPQQARVLAERGRAFVREAFSLERAVGQTEDFYRRLRLAQAA